MVLDAATRKAAITTALFCEWLLIKRALILSVYNITVRTRVQQVSKILTHIFRKREFFKVKEDLENRYPLD